MAVYYTVYGVVRVPKRLQAGKEIGLSTEHEVLSMEYRIGRDHNAPVVAFEAHIKVQDPRPTLVQVQADVRLSVAGERVRGGQYEFKVTDAK